MTIDSGKTYTSAIYVGTTLNNESKEAQQECSRYLNDLENNLALTIADPMINQLIYISKIRATESIFGSSKLGVIHSPNGGIYFLGHGQTTKQNTAGRSFLIWDMTWVTMRRITPISYLKITY